MEEDIEILEEFIKYYEAEAISRKFRGTLSISVDEDDIEALENLIKGYRDLEEQIDKHVYFETTNPKEIEKNFIPKSKIKEKLEEFDKEYHEILKDYGNIDTDVIFNIPNENVRKHLDKLVEKIIVLQELMEDK